MKKVIAFFELEDWEKEYLRKKLSNHKLVFVDQKLDEKNLRAAVNADAIGVFVYSQITRQILSKLPKLKLLVTLSTGFDHIDVGAAAHKKITVCNVPAYGENTVAEHAFGLLLALTHNLVPAIERTRRGNFDLTGLQGIDIKGKTIGIIGTGRIGKCSIQIAKGFGMKVIAYDKFANKQLAKELGFSYVKLNDLLKNSDVISIHAPYTPETHHIINKRNILRIKKGCILINTARGGIVETEAILLGLKRGILRGVGLDVLEEECFVKEEKELLSESFKKTCNYKTILAEHMLIEMDNVLITPHSAFYSREALQRILDTTIENINGFFRGKSVNIIKV